jgi:PTH1 family peptidyl-tRNA hydrolase
MSGWTNPTNCLGLSLRRALFIWYTSDMKLIVGLGNPGKQYADTRHNLGFNVVDRFLTDFSEKTKVNVPDLVGELYRIGSDRMVLKPTSYMNNSGVEVKKVVNFFKIQNADILVVHDEVDLPLGEMKLETGRSSAGNRGVESIIEQLGTKDFYRLRLGVSRPPEGTTTDSYVLEQFTSEETSKLEEIISTSIPKIQDWLSS